MSSLLGRISSWFRNLKKRRLIITHRLKDSDDRLFFERKHECPACHESLKKEDLEASMYVCPFCQHHFRLTPWERIKYLADGGVFHEFAANLETANPLEFPEYEQKIANSVKKTGLKEAILTGLCRIDGKEVVLGVMAFEFLGGSMGSVVGEKVTRAMLLALEKRIPLIIFTSSGGARMHEGIFSLMQMAKTSAAASLLDAQGVPFFIVLTDPTTGGVTASYAMLGDVILAEPGALIGFAGRRVVDGTIKEKLPDNFQTAEFQLEHGFVDAIVHRKDLRRTLAYLIDSHINVERVWK